jgi:F-type H+-transporting ATPase subunit b
VLLDPFTVVAQIFNFLVLVFLLRRFLYGPIVRAMQEREERVLAREEDAEAARQEALQEAAAYRERNSELERAGHEMLAQARAEAEAERRAQINLAREEIEELKARWHQALEREQSEFLDELRRRIAGQVHVIARKALQDLADADLEQRMVDRFIGRVRGMDPGERHEIIAAARRSGEDIVVTSAFELPQETTERLLEAVRREVGDGIGVHFDRSHDLMLGIEMRAHGHKLSWTLDAYLDSLAENLFDALEAETENQRDGQEQEQQPVAAGSA